MAQSNQTRIKHSLDLLLEFAFLAIWVTIGLNRDWFGIWVEVDMVGNGSDWG